MFRNCAVLASLVAVVVAVTAPSPQAASQFAPLSRINHLTFSGPAALPGVTLAPGTYVFESDPASTNPNLVRVLSRNRQRVFFSGLTMPVVRHSDESSSSRLVNPPGAPHHGFLRGTPEARSPGMSSCIARSSRGAKATLLRTQRPPPAPPLPASPQSAPLPPTP